MGRTYLTGMYSGYRLQRSWGKVIFSHASVILSTGGEGACSQRGAWSLGVPGPREGLPGGDPTSGTDTAAGGTHPTGMHSCSNIFLRDSFLFLGPMIHSCGASGDTCPGS